MAYCLHKYVLRFQIKHIWLQPTCGLARDRKGYFHQEYGGGSIKRGVVERAISSVDVVPNKTCEEGYINVKQCTRDIQ